MGMGRTFGRSRGRVEELEICNGNSSDVSASSPLSAVLGKPQFHKICEIRIVPFRGAVKKFQIQTEVLGLGLWVPGRRARGGVGKGLGTGLASSTGFSGSSAWDSESRLPMRDRMPRTWANEGKPKKKKKKKKKKQCFWMKMG